jgi:tRNA-(ms[2]io[6]A)-hydroxylase
MVHKHILKRGFVIGRDRKDEYVARVTKFFAQTGDRKLRLVHRLLIAALIEARSCERFKVLSENIEDQELASFYAKLMVSEANHYTLFLKFARQYGKREDVDKKWDELLTFEAEVMKDFGDKELIHG